MIDDRVVDVIIEDLTKGTMLVSDIVGMATRIG